MGRDPERRALRRRRVEGWTRARATRDARVDDAETRVDDARA